MNFNKVILLMGFVNIQVLCAQVPKGIVKASAFLQEITMGNIPVDNGGQPLRSAIDTAYFIIVETKGSQLPKWEMAYTSTMAYTFSLTDSTKMETDELIASRGQVMKAGKGNKLWKYELVPSESKRKCTAKNGQIIIEGRYNNHVTTITIKEITTLPPELRP